MAALDEVERQLRHALGASGRPDGAPPTASAMPGDDGPPLGQKDGRDSAPARPAHRAPLRPGPGQPPGPVVSRYETFEDLVGYCRLSANPVGRMVLAIFGVATPQRNAWSDSTCTALQLVEHWQDVAEDAIVGPRLPARWKT